LLEEANCCLSISATLKVYVNNFTVLIDCAPKNVLFALDFYEDLIDKEAVPVSLVPPSKSPGVFGPKLDTPQSGRFVADHDSALGHEIFDVTNTQIEAVIEPDSVLNDLGRKRMTLIRRCGLIHSAIVVQIRLTCQYPLLC